MKLFIFGFVVLVGFFIFLILLFIPVSPLCHSSQINISSNVQGTVIFSDDGSKVAFARLVEMTRKAVGLCSYPDGGSSYIVKKYMQIFVVPADGSLPPGLLANVDILLSHELNGRTGNLAGWENNKIIYDFSSESGQGKYFEINTDNGQVDTLPSNTYKELKTKYWGQAAVSFRDPRIYVKMGQNESYDSFLGIYKNKEIILDSDRKKWLVKYFDGELQKVLVSPDMMKNLSLEMSPPPPKIDSVDKKACQGNECKTDYGAPVPQ